MSMHRLQRISLSGNAAVMTLGICKPELPAGMRLVNLLEPQTGGAKDEELRPMT